MYYVVNYKENTMQKRLIVDINLKPFYKKGIALIGSSIVTIMNENKTKSLTIGIGVFKYYAR